MNFEVKLMVIPSFPYPPKIGQFIYIDRWFSSHNNRIIYNFKKDVFPNDNYRFVYLPFEDRLRYFFLSDDEYLDRFSLDRSHFGCLYNFLEGSYILNLNKENTPKITRRVNNSQLTSTFCAKYANGLNDTSGFITFTGHLIHDDPVFLFFPIDDSVDELFLQYFAFIINTLNESINTSNESPTELTYVIPIPEWIREIINNLHSPDTRRLCFSSFGKYDYPDLESFVSSCSPSGKSLCGTLDSDDDYKTLCINGMGSMNGMGREYYSDTIKVEFSPSQATLYWFFIRQTRPLDIRDLSSDKFCMTPNQKQQEIFTICQYIYDNPNASITLTPNNIRKTISEINQKIINSIAADYGKNTVKITIAKNIKHKPRKSNQNGIAKKNMDFNIIENGTQALSEKTLSYDELINLRDRLRQAKKGKKQLIYYEPYANQAMKIAIKELNRCISNMEKPEPENITTEELYQIIYSAIDNDKFQIMKNAELQIDEMKKTAKEERESNEKKPQPNRRKKKKKDIYDEIYELERDLYSYFLILKDRNFNSSNGYAIFLSCRRSGYSRHTTDIRHKIDEEIFNKK